jgi:hypothetical protein
MLPGTLDLIEPESTALEVVLPKIGGIMMTKDVGNEFDPIIEAAFMKLIGRYTIDSHNTDWVASLMAQDTMEDFSEEIKQAFTREFTLRFEAWFRAMKRIHGDN